MKSFETKSFRAFDMFNNQWGLVTADGPDHFNTCAIGRGSLGTIRGSIGQGK